MSEIEVGEYVRTKNGNIAQVIEFRDELVLDKEIKFCGIYRSYLNEDELDFIVKHSKNIIDLIEVGDYVNGYKVVDFEFTYFNGNDRRKEPKRIEVIVDNKKYKFENHIKKDDMKTIVTHEQMASIEYKV